MKIRLAHGLAYVEAALTFRGKTLHLDSVILDTGSASTLLASDRLLEPGGWWLAGLAPSPSPGGGVLVPAVAVPQPIDRPAVVDRPAPPIGQRRVTIHGHAVARESRGQGRDGLSCRDRQGRRLEERPAVGSIEARFAVGR